MPPTAVADPPFRVDRPDAAADPRAAREPFAVRVPDRLLDGLLVAFAAWTLIYDVCLIAHVQAVWAALAWVLALAGCAVVLRRRGEEDAQPWRAAERLPLRLPHPRWLLVASLVAAVAAALLFGLTSLRWYFVWVLWLGAAAAAAAWCLTRAATERPAPPPVSPSRLEIGVVGAWALGLAALTLFLLNPDSDDAYYVHLSTWTAAHGIFPLRDVMFSHNVLPALLYPPASSWEALVGTAARLTPLSVPGILYVVVPPVAAFLSVLATWRLLRRWRVPQAWLALSVACVFLVFGATTTRALGLFAFARVWQGKALVVTLLVPLLFALAHEYSERPTRRRLGLLACGGVAGVGLSTTAIFVVPVIALGCMAPVALRSLRVAASGFAALAGYPLAVGLLSLVVGGRAPDLQYSVHDLEPQNLVHWLLGANLVTALAVAAILAAPVLLPYARGGAMLAVTALVVGGLFAPRIAVVLFRHIGLGRELSRLVWAVPVAALVGALATTIVAERHRRLRYLPAVAAIAAIAVAGRPVWVHAVGSQFAAPGWKRWPTSVTQAKGILANTRPGDVVLAPRMASETLLVMSADVLPVGTRPLYVRPLEHNRAAKARKRLGLLYVVGKAPLPPSSNPRKRAAQVSRIRRGLAALSVDLACTDPTIPEQRPMHALLVAAGYSQPVPAAKLACLRRPA